MEGGRKGSKELKKEGKLGSEELKKAGKWEVRNGVRKQWKRSDERK